MKQKSISNTAENINTIDDLTRVYDLYSPMLFRYAMRLLGDQALAEDCVAETFHRYLETIRSQRSVNSNLKAYLYRITHNLITDHYRRKVVDQLPDDTELPDHVEEINTSLERKQDMEIARRALRILTPDQRQVIILRYFENWKNEDIAVAINKPVNAVKALQFRAIQAIRKYFAAEEIE